MTLVKFLMFGAVLLASCVLSFGQSYKRLITKGDSLYTAKDYGGSLKFYKKAFAIEKKNPDDLYNAACSAALSNKKKEAIALLNYSIDMGWADINHLKDDSDLSSLHGLKAWDELIIKLQQNVDKIEANYNKPLRAELLAILEDDQPIRRTLTKTIKEYGYKHPKVDSLEKIMLYKDSIDLIKVVKILDQYGWVGSDKVGRQANQTIFLVIQHSNLSTQQKYLPMMREAVKKGNASISSLALLEDRVTLGEGKKQIYGSQIGITRETGEYFVSPLEDPDNVDKRRAEVGLGPLAEYVKQWNITWNVEEYKKAQLGSTTN